MNPRQGDRMKKKFLCLCLLIICTGCSNLKNLDYEQILNTAFNSNYNITNENRKGYLYYLPKGMRIIKSTGNNEILSKNQDLYYLYVDLVSYYNKVESEYKEKKDVIFSKNIKKDDKFGYLEIKKTTNEKYFIEIMYNYAKIEVIVKEEKLKETLAYCSSILTSINYQDTVLKSLMDENSLKSSEVMYNIFETADTESSYLQIAEEYGQYEEEQSVDPDFIRR